MRIKDEYKGCQVTYSTGFITRTVKLDSISDKELHDLYDWGHIAKNMIVFDEPTKAKKYKGITPEEDEIR